jgi:hypothetical protein
MAPPLPPGHEPTTAGSGAAPTNPVLKRPAAIDPAGLVGTLLGEYQVLDVLAVGGMGVVYRGVQPVIGKPVAIKVLLPELGNDAEHAHRLLTEARAVNTINHPHIVSIFSFGQTPGGQPFFVMELLNGESLLRWQRRRGRAPVSVGQTLSILEQVLGALEAAHAAGVVHRDLKPGNLFMTPVGDGFHVTVLDFGTAKGLSTPIAQFATKPGLVLGTVGFMAPEQMMGLHVTPAIDIYAMGVVAFWLLTGTDVFTGESDLELAKAHLWSGVPTLASRGAEVPAPLEALVASMLAKDPGTRPAAGDALRTVQGIAKDLRAPAPATAAPAAAEEPTRVWPLVLTGVALAAIGAGVFAVLSVDETPGPLPDLSVHAVVAPPPPRAERAPEREVTPAPAAAPARPKVVVVAPTPPRPPAVKHAAATPTRETVGAYLRELNARSESLPEVQRRAAQTLVVYLSSKLAGGASPTSVLEEARSVETRLHLEPAP